MNCTTDLSEECRVILKRCLSCPVCQGRLKGAVSTRCGHTFCESCLDVWIKKGRTNCPECREHISPGQVHPVFAIRNLLTELPGESCSELTESLTVPKSANQIQDRKGETFPTTMMIPEHSPLSVSESEINLSQLRGYTTPSAIRASSGGELGNLAMKLSKLEADVSTVQRVIQENQLANVIMENRLTQLRIALQYPDVKPMQSGGHNSLSWDDKRGLTHPFCGEFMQQPSRMRLPDKNTIKETISSLRTFIAFNLTTFPSGQIDLSVEDVFQQISSHIDSCTSGDFPDLKTEVQMLVATAFAASWFDNRQRKHFREKLYEMAHPKL